MRPAVLLVLVAACARPLVTAHPSFSVTSTGHGRPILFIPGLACGPNVWDHEVRRLEGHNEVHVITLAGFAGEPRVPAPSLATARAEIARWVREQKLERPIIVGHSLGGFLAVWLAETEPELFAAVVIVEAAPFLPVLTDPGATVESIRPHADAVRAKLAESLAANTAKTVARMIKDTAEAERIAGQSAGSDPSAVADDVRELMTTDLRPQLAAIRAPTLVVVAGASQKDVYAAQTEAIPGRKLVQIPDTLHFVMLDAPAAFDEALDRFLEEAQSVSVSQTANVKALVAARRPSR